MLLPWTFEANDIDLKNINADNIFDQFIVHTPVVEEFLKCGSDDIKYFVVGPKGLGKTFLLKVKSKFYRELSGYHCIPSGGGELVEKLTSIRVSFSRAELGGFIRIETWEKTWELSIFTMILRSFNVEMPAELKKIIGEARTLLDILSAFIQSRSAIDRLYSEYVATFLRPKVGELREHGANQIAIFIDNIDEGIEEHGYNQKNAAGTLSEDVWINAQLGMMKIARDICQRNKHIKMFVSIRSEAFNNDRSATALQSKNNAAILEYTKTQIKEIFEQNISITEKKHLAKPQATDLIERFVGFSKMDHRFARDANNVPLQENTFDFIFRHTFGRPREVVLMGNKIAKIPVNERRRDQEAVREMVNSVSDDLLQQLRREIVPFFEDEVFDKFCDLVRGNIISIEQAGKISREILDYYPQFTRDVFPYLYSIGLIGTTEREIHRQHPIQKFLPVGQYSLSDNIPPKASEYFIIHSSVDRTLKSKHGPHFYDKNNIIGDTLDFYTPENATTNNSGKILHTHFGLGRDSLTLIIPELSKNKSIAIIQKPSKDDHELSQVQFVAIRATMYDQINFKVINDNSTESQINEVIGQWEHGGNILIYSNKAQLIGRVVDLSETMTLWSSNFLAPAQEGDMIPSVVLNEMKSDTKGKVLYLCQRVINKQVLKAIKNQIRDKGLDEKLSVETAVIDRLEYKTLRFKENNTLIYDVEAEEYGSIICRDRTASKNEHKQIVRRTPNLKEQSFYEDLQKYIVEGVYRLTKIIKKGLTDRDRKISNLDEIYNLFFDIQIANLASKHKLRYIYPEKSQTQIVMDLKAFCHKHKERFLKLEKFPGFIDSQANYIRDSKRMGAFPTDKKFFQLARQSSVFINSQAVLELRKLLRIKDLANYYSVFICFSALDESFTKKVSDSLRKRGVDTYYFKEDHRVGTIKSVEQKEIAERDKILFIASENSITSYECQDELSLGITKRQGGINDPTKEQILKDIFIPIHIDSYIWDVEEQKLELRLANAREAWKNIRMIKQQASTDFSEFRDKEVNDDFEEKIDTTIMPALFKSRSSKLQ